MSNLHFWFAELKSLKGLRWRGAILVLYNITACGVLQLLHTWEIDECEVLEVEMEVKKGKPSASFCSMLRQLARARDYDEVKKKLKYG